MLYYQTLTTDQVIQKYIPSISSLWYDSFVSPNGIISTNSLVNIQAQQEKEHNMCFETTTTEDKSLTYLRRRIGDLYWVFDHKIRDKYALPEPKDKDEAEKWIKEKNFHFADMDVFCYEDPFRWGKDPVDLKARDAAYTDLEQARQHAMDIINVVTDEDKRLKALKDFESYTIH